MLSNTVFYLFQAILPLMLLYYVCTLCSSRVISTGTVLRMGIPTIALVFIILTNPFTEKLFYFDSTGYCHGPWYLLLYISALLHIAAAAIFVAVHRDAVSRRNLTALLTIFLLAAFGIAAQAVNPAVLTTGFGLSLSILAMYLTINNPCACMDSLTGLNDKQYLLRRMNELTDAHKAFHIITVYAYQLDHMNKVSGVQSGDEFLRRAAEHMQEIAGRNVFRVTGKRFLLLTFSLREYEACLTSLRQVFHTQPDDAQAAPSPVILCGVVGAEKLGTGGLVLDYAEYLESLAARSGGTEVIQNDRKNRDSFYYNKQVEQFLHRAIDEDLFEVYYQPVYSLHQQRFITLEALSRLRHPTLGWICLLYTSMSRSLTLDGVTYTGIAVSYDTDVVDDLVDGSMYGGQSDCYVVRSNGDIVLELEPQTELCEGMTNLYDLSDHVDWKYGSMDDIRDCIQLDKSGSAQFTCDGTRNYLVAIPTAFSDWSLVGVIQTDEVDGAMLSVQQSTIIALGALCIFAVIIVVLALGMEDQLRLRREEEERLNLEREKMKSDRFLQSMSRIVDRYMVVNLDTGRYRYHELRSSEPLYPTSGQYSEMVEIISKRYVALTETENAKLSRLLTPDYLRSVLRKPDDNLKVEYCSRTENAYMVLTVLPVEWHADGTVAVVMQVVQDIGQKVELENMANTDSLTGLFNERYFSRVLNICEAKKLPFVLYYLDLDRFKPVNDTYGHAMGDRLLKEISARLLRCIRSRDYAFRIGGDEFALIVSADMDEEQRSRMAERIQTMLSAPIVIEEKVLSVGVSCGCACYPEDGDASQVRIMADSRMYAEKQHHHEDDRTEEQS